MVRQMKRNRLLVALGLSLGLAVTAGCGETGGPVTPGQPPDSTATPPVNPTPDATPQPAKVVRFIAIGDTGTGEADQYGVAAAIEGKCALDGCDFGLLLGDNFYPSGVDGVDDPQWSIKLEEPYANLDFPFYVTLGNHDYGGDGAGYEFELGQIQVAYAQESEKWTLPSEYYHFEEGAGTFLALGTNLIFWDYSDAVSEQGAYFSQALSQSTQPWKIAFGHHPYVSNGKHGNAGSYEGFPFLPVANGASVKSFFDQYLCGKVDLYICGHDHSRQVLPGPASCPGTFVVSGAGAKTTELPGSNPALFEKSSEGFAYFVLGENSLVIEMYDMSGALDYTTELTK